MTTNKAIYHLAGRQRQGFV
ncbi:hypothetical protein, partial [Leptodesmis sp.]